MDLLIAFVLFFAALVACLIVDITMWLPLAFGLLCFVAVGMRRGYAFKSLMKMSWDGAKSSFVVLRVFVLIGLITALWRVGGIIPYFVYNGIKIITPSMFIVIAFLLTSLLAYALGTSFGIIGTVGIILMALARSGGVSEIITAGAVMSGAYFGDRNAPTASSAHLVAAVTGTRLFDNVKMMLKTGALPFAVSLAVYFVLSVQNPIKTVDEELLVQLQSSFSISPWLLLPAGLMLVLPVLKVEVRRAMIISIAASFLCAVLVQGEGILETLKICVIGYYPQNSAFSQILSGGGLLSMLDVSGIVLLSCTYSGIFEGTGMLSKMQDKVLAVTEKIGRYPTTMIISLLTTAGFCNQTIAVVLTNQLVAGVYDKAGASRGELAQDLENSAIMIPGLIPWSIACTVPLQMLGVGFEALPYSVFLYAVPVLYLFTKRFFYREKDKAACQK